MPIEVNDEPTGALIDPGRWRAAFPESIFEGLSGWIRGQAFDLELIRRYDDGASGSYVAAVMIQRYEGRTQGAVLKVLPPQLAHTESRGVQLAVESGPADFVGAHVAPTLAVSALPGTSGAWVHLQDVATDGAASMQSLASLAGEPGFGAYCATVLASLAREWNPGANEPRATPMTPAEYLKGDLADRVAGLREMAVGFGWRWENLPSEFRLPGGPPLPNPLVLVGPESPAGEPVRIFRGRGHGDLHPGNVMIPVTGRQAAAHHFRLIDLGRFSSSMEISRDPAKLLLSVVAGWLGPFGPDAPLRADLAQIIVEPDTYVASTPTAGYAEAARAMYAAAAGWAVERRVVEQWAIQHRLVVGAAALRTAARGELPLRDRWWHLEVAARALVPFLPAVTGTAIADIAPHPVAVPVAEPVDAPEDDLHRMANLLREALRTQDDRKLVVLVGAGLTSSRVPGVSRLTTLATEFADQRGSTRLRVDLPESLPDRPGGVQQVLISRYSEALQFVYEARGPDALRAFLQQVSMQALVRDRPQELSSEPLTDDEYAALERRADRWRPPESLTLLAEILRLHGRNVHSLLLTTNFDPLAEVALRRAGLRIEPSRAIGNPEHPVAGLSNGVAGWTVVHLHGTPHSQSLHYPVRIAPHEEVEDWLASLIRGNRLLVLGYSGWDRLIQRTVLRHFGRRLEEKSDQGTEVLWAVYEPRHQHPNVDPELADFFERNVRRGITAFYGIEGDRLLRTLSEELNGRRTATGFYSTVKELSQSYQFGHSHIRPDAEPGFVFWPHRLREPHLLHGVHALTAALLSKRNVPIELHLDDTDMTDAYADDRAAEFTDAVLGWFEKCGASEPPKILRIRRLIDDLAEDERAMRLWRLASDLFHREVTALDALLASKVVSADRGRTTVEPTGAHRLLRPLYTWLALDDAIARNRREDTTESTILTLGGIDEQKMWDVWRARRGASPVASLYVPRLETPTNPWAMRELNRYDTFGRADLERVLALSAGSWETGEALLEWVFTAGRLATLASDGAVAPLRTKNGAVMSWNAASSQLRLQPSATCHEMAESVSAWFYHDVANIR